MKRNGFTIVEVLIVLVIIGLLASIAIPNFVRARGNAVKPVVRLLAEKGYYSSEPVCLSNGWYYISGAETNMNYAVASLIRSVGDKDPTSIHTYLVVDGHYGTHQYSWVISRAVDQLSITNGCFVFIGKE